jgi:hypothetical protein
VEWRANGQLFYGRSEEVVMRVPYRIDGSTFVAEKPQVWMRIPPGVSWVEPAMDGTRAAAIRSRGCPAGVDGAGGEFLRAPAARRPVSQ